MLFVGHIGDTVDVDVTQSESEQFLATILLATFRLV